MTRHSISESRCVTTIDNEPKKGTVSNKKPSDSLRNVCINAGVENIVTRIHLTNGSVNWRITPSSTCGVTERIVATSTACCCSHALIGENGNL